MWIASLKFSTQKGVDMPFVIGFVLGWIACRKFDGDIGFIIRKK
jgi:hypothetical protein